MPIFPCPPAALAALATADPALGAAIHRIGAVERSVIPDLFTALADAIAGQQISGAAQRTVMARLFAAVGDCANTAATPLLSPGRVLAASDEALRACGLSARKAAWLRAVAQTVRSGALDARSLAALPDDAVIARLTALPGVGVWTAEMLLLFCLQRPDVLSWGDFGIRRGLCLVHGLDALTKEQFSHWRALYSPYGSVASLYLWAVSGETPPTPKVKK